MARRYICTCLLPPHRILQEVLHRGVNLAEKMFISALGRYKKKKEIMVYDGNKVHLHLSPSISHVTAGGITQRANSRKENVHIYIGRIYKHGSK